MNTQRKAREAKTSKAGRKGGSKAAIENRRRRRKAAQRRWSRRKKQERKLLNDEERRQARGQGPAYHHAVLMTRQWREAHSGDESSNPRTSAAWREARRG